MCSQSDCEFSNSRSPGSGKDRKSIVNLPIYLLQSFTQDAVSVFETVIQKFKNASFNYQKGRGEENQKIEEDQKKSNTFFTTLALEDFFIRFAEKQLLNSTFFEFSAKDSHNVGE